MTDQSPNDIFRASSFLQGHNAEYIEQLQARYATDPASVDEARASFFRQLGTSEPGISNLPIHPARAAPGPEGYGR